MLKQKEEKFGPVKDHAVSSNSSVTDRFNTCNMLTLQANTATLKVILSNIVEWILKSGKKCIVLCLSLKYSAWMRNARGGGIGMKEREREEYVHVHRHRVGS